MNSRQRALAKYDHSQEGAASKGAGIALSLFAGALLLLKGCLLLGHHSANKPMFTLETKEIPPLSVAEHAISMPWVVKRVVATDQLALAAAAEGYILLSEDGIAWRPLTVSRLSPTLIGAAIRVDGRLLVLDENNVVYVSTDIGQSWISRALKLKRTKNSNEFSRCALTRTGNLLCELPTGLRASEDMGESWHPIAEGIEHPTLLTASAESEARATQGHLRKEYEAQVQGLLDQMGRQAGIEGFGSSGTRLPRFRYSNLEDIAYSADLMHWVRVTEDGIYTSHDKGKNFTLASIEKRSSPQDKIEIDSPDEIKVPIASNISQDGQSIVVVLGKQELESETGTLLDKVDTTSPFRVLLSTDAGRSFIVVTDTYRAYDIAAVHFINPANGEILIFENGIGGFSRLTREGERTHVATGGYGLSDTAVIGAHRVYAGSRLATEIDGTLKWMTREASPDGCDPLTMVFSPSFDSAVGVSADGCVLSSKDGIHWKQSKTAIADAVGTSADYLDLKGRIDQLSIDRDRWILQLSPPTQATVASADEDAGSTTGSSSQVSAPASPSSGKNDELTIVVSTDWGQHWAKKPERGPGTPDKTVTGSLSQPDNWKPKLSADDRQELSTWDCSSQRRALKRRCIGAAADSGRFYLSVDGGRQWRVAALPEVPEGLKFVRQSDDDQHIVIGASSGILRSDDGGATYQHLNIE